MNKEELLALATKIIDKNKYAMVGINGLKKHPNIYALMKMKNEGLYKFYFTTKKDSNKIKQIKKNEKGCLYFYDEEEYQSVMIEGTFSIEKNETVPIADLYKLDPHDPFTFCTVVFETESLYVYTHYKTIKLRVK